MTYETNLENLLGKKFNPEVVVYENPQWVKTYYEDGYMEEHIELLMEDDNEMKEHKDDYYNLMWEFGDEVEQSMIDNHSDGEYCSCCYDLLCELEKKYGEIGYPEKISDGKGWLIGHKRLMRFTIKCNICEE